MVTHESIDQSFYSSNFLKGKDMGFIACFSFVLRITFSLQTVSQGASYLKFSGYVQI